MGKYTLILKCTGVYCKTSHANIFVTGGKRVNTLFCIIINNKTYIHSVENGERVGGCPTPVEVSNMPRPRTPIVNECNVDTDCTGNAVHKCCPEHYSGLNLCVKPVPGGLNLDC